MIKIYEFLTMEADARYITVWDDGVHLDTYVTQTLVCQLYSLGDFFVEIQYDPNTNEIIGNLPFKHGEHLEKYLPEL